MRTTFTYRIIVIMLCWLFTSTSLEGQIAADVVRVENDSLMIRIDNRKGEEYKNLLFYFGLNEDSLFNYKNIGPLAKEGWALTHIDKHVAEIGKPISTDSLINWGSQPVIFNGNIPLEGTPGYPAPVPYGLNNFKGTPGVFENKNDETVFFLKGNMDAKNVLLSGNFNNWSTSSTPMTKTDTGWVMVLKLKPGKYFYKYIVDGTWIHDTNNELKEDDGYTGYNSTYFHYNHTFRLKGYTGAKNVIVSGSFNGWNEKELKLKKTTDGWALDLYLREGTHAYKFIVDGEWILDPANPVVRPDGMGHFNSFIGVGDTTLFILNGYTSARLVILTGSFNAWNTAELEMKKISGGWELPYVLAPGNYEYKYIVDGTWISDPQNPFTTGKNEETNSCRIVGANYNFMLEAFPNAKEVLLSGSFNNWADPGYRMMRSDGGWRFPVYLPAGKYTYKFVVDGNWILDPANPLIEENEHGTGNSVIWIEPQEQFMEK